MSFAETNKNSAVAQQLRSLLNSGRLVHAFLFVGTKEERLQTGRALARAILHDSPVYIFDEATSNIDVESEEAILEQILKIAEDKTVIMISHRLANVTKADRIYCLEHGRVAESGTHEELLAACGAYAKIWNTQQELENYGKGASKGGVL